MSWHAWYVTVKGGMKNLNLRSNATFFFFRRCPHSTPSPWCILSSTGPCLRSLMMGGTCSHQKRLSEIWNRWYRLTFVHNDYCCFPKVINCWLSVFCWFVLWQTDEWRLSEVNKNFNVCPSYPSLVAVPREMDDDTLRKAAAFRHGGRFPVLSYYHKKNGMVSCSLWGVLYNSWIKIRRVLSVCVLRWWCEQDSLWLVQMDAAVRKTRNWSTLRCVQGNVVTSSTRALLL